MELRNGSNGSMFNCNFVPGNVGFNNGLMSLKIDSDGRGGYTGANGVVKNASAMVFIK